LVNADILVADLTDHNPNVLWELGVRQSFKHCTITIAEVGTKIPFHFSHKGILFYNGDHLNNKDFEDQFEKSLKDSIKHPEVPDSPVLETLGGRGTLYNIVHDEENQRRLQALYLEITDNEKLLGQIHKLCEKNKSLRSKGKKGRQMVSYTLRKVAAEFLYIDRYLDKPKEFYYNLCSHLDNIEATNRKLETWQDRPVLCEKWLLENEEIIDNVIKILKKDSLM